MQVRYRRELASTTRTRGESRTSFLGKLLGKKDMQELEQLQKELDALQKKSNAELLVLFGAAGKLKGLDLLTASTKGTPVFASKQVKRFAAKGAEFLNRFKMLDFLPAEIEEPVRVIKFYYTPSKQFYVITIPGNESFALLAFNASASKLVAHDEKLVAILNKIRPDKEEGNTS